MVRAQHVSGAVALAVALVASGPAGADVDGLGATGRAAGARGEYTHAAGVDGGVAAVWWREPLGAVDVDGAVGVAIATSDGHTAATLLNPRARARYHVDARTAAALELTLPAASKQGDGGAVAAALAAAHRVDPAPWLAGATTLAAGFERWWTRPLGELGLGASLAWTTRGDAPDLPLVHLDAVGAAALTDRIHLTARLRTTAYGLVSDRDEDFVHALAMGARYRDCRVSVDAALEVPVDAADRAAGTLWATIAVAWRL